MVIDLHSSVMMGQYLAGVHFFLESNIKIMRCCCSVIAFHMTYSSSKVYPSNFLHTQDSGLCCQCPAHNTFCWSSIIRCKTQLIELKLAPSGVDYCLVWVLEHQSLCCLGRFKTECKLCMHLRQRSSFCKDKLHGKVAVSRMSRNCGWMQRPCYGV